MKNSKGTESNHIFMIRSTESNDEVEIELQISMRVRVSRGCGPNYTAYKVEEDPINIQEALLFMDADF